MHDGRKNKRQNVLDLYKVAGTHILYTNKIRKCSVDIISVSKMCTFDSLHIVAEEVNADVLLIIDDKFEKTAEKLDLRTRVINPFRLALEVVNVNLSNPIKIGNVGIRALKEALGSAGMVKFMQQYDMGAGDYTKKAGTTKCKFG